LGEPFQNGGVADSVELRGGAGLGTAPFGSGPGWEIDWGHSEAVAGRAGRLAGPGLRGPEMSGRRLPMGATQRQPFGTDGQ